MLPAVPYLTDRDGNSDTPEIDVSLLFDRIIRDISKSYIQSEYVHVLRDSVLPMSPVATAEDRRLARTYISQNGVNAHPDPAYIT